MVKSKQRGKAGSKKSSRSSNHRSNGHREKKRKLANGIKLVIPTTVEKPGQMVLFVQGARKVQTIAQTVTGKERELANGSNSLQMMPMIQTTVIAEDKLNGKFIPLVLPKKEFWNLVLSLQITRNIIARGCVLKQIKGDLEPTIVLVQKLLLPPSRICRRKTQKNLQFMIYF